MEQLDASHPLPALRAAADPTRLRLIRLLDLAELNVGELAAVTGIAQSNVSRHVALLRAAGFVEERSEGVRTYVHVAATPSEAVAPLLGAILAAVRSPEFGHADDLERLERVRRERETEREAAFDVLAADWDAVRRELLGGALSPPQIASLFAPAGMRIVDAGAGTGLSLPWLSAIAGPGGRVIAVERSAAMLSRAKERAEGLSNVEFRRGRIEDLPVPDGWADALVLSLSLHQTADPAATLARCVRAVAPGGRVVVADVASHGDATLVARLGKGFAGFEADELTSIMTAAGLEDVRTVPLAREADPTRTNGGPRRSRARDIPKLTPLLAAGTVPGNRRGSTRRTR